MKGSSSWEVVENILSFYLAKNLGKARIKAKLLHENAQMPMRVTPSDVGFDVSTVKVEDCGDFIKIYSGVSIQPLPGLYFELVPRSSIYKKGLIMHNSLGIIDPNYRGEIIGVFYKTDGYIEPKIGDRLMQLIPHQYLHMKFECVDELGETERGEKGFGSSG